MPRPGPRPYECVRRAWHSDRHQPIRGSLIKEIFRVANEIHSWPTKQNKEWQEKLPTVVLRAEEIMYSKANSEAEYMDLKTLWERTNDAMNTIIRRDEGSETGQFLQPCIEAALILGCTPRRASRSQRNWPPSCYLGSGGAAAAADHSHASPAAKSHSAYPLFYGHVVARLDRPGAAKKLESGELGCDLSLRLGPLSVVDEKKNKKKDDISPVEAAAAMRKRKAGFDPISNELCLRPKLPPFRHVTGSQG